MADIIYARVINGAVYGTPITVPDDIVLGTDLFTADEAALYHPCGSNVQDGWTYDGKVFAAPVTPPVTVDLVAYAASVRYGKETGGFTYQGHSIATDEASQSKIGNAALGATIVGSTFSTEWKANDGSFFPLNQGGMISMATAVLTYINGCFATEATVAAGIKAGTIKTTAAVDGAAWPASSSS